MRNPLTSLSRWDRVYVGLSSGVVLFVLGYVINGRRSGDVYLHVSVIERFAADPWSPANPMVATDDPDVGFSPYLLVLGLLSRVTSLSGFDVVDVAGLALVVTFLVLFRQAVLVLVLTATAGAPVVALVLTLTAWGFDPWRWSGYLNLNAIGFMTGYPSMAAWCALLAAVIIAARLSSGREVGSVLALAGLMAFIALTHPITLIGAVPLVGGVVARGRDRVGLLRLSAAGAVALAMVALWPYFSVLDLLDGGEGYDLLNRPTYRRVWERSLLAVPGFVALAWPARRSPVDPLVITAVTGGAVFVLVAAGVQGSAAGIVAAAPRDLLPPSLRNDDRLESEMDRYAFLDGHLHAGDVVVTDSVFLDRAVPTTGASAVAPGYPTPYVDVGVRRRDGAAFLGGGEEERSAVADRYGITHALVSVDRIPGGDGFELVAETSRYRLFAVR